MVAVLLGSLAIQGCAVAALTTVGLAGGAEIKHTVSLFGLALPDEPEHRLMTTLREKLVKIGAKVVRHGRDVTFQLAEMAVLRNLFQKTWALDANSAPNGGRPFTVFNGAFILP